MDRSERNTNIFVFVVILAMVTFYLIITLNEKNKPSTEEQIPNTKTPNCILLNDNVEYDDNTTFKIDNKEYQIDSSLGDYLYLANRYEEVDVKACIDENTITGYEIIDKKTNKKINASDIDSFLVAIGYYKIDNHTDNLTYKGLVEQYDAELEPEFEGMAPMPYKCYVMLFENSKGKELKIVNRDFSGTFTENYPFIEGEKYNVIFGMEKLKTHEIQFWYLDLVH